MSMLPDWDGAKTKNFLRAPLTFQHNLLDTGAFTEEAFERLLETHPDDFTDVNLYTINDAGRAHVQTGTRGQLSGAQLLDAIKKGRLWVNIRQAGLSDPRIQQAVSDVFAAIGQHVAGFRPLNILTNLLISGPTARVPYHADTPAVILLHLMGKKRVWIYPNHGKHLSDAAMEKVALRETTEDLPFDPAWDADATIVDLLPGMAANWPYNAPHRVDNQGTFNASLSCEFMTWEGRLRHGAYYTNGTMRRKMGVAPTPIAQLGPLGRAWRFAAATAIKRLHINKAREKRHPIEFSVSDIA